LAAMLGSGEVTPESMTMADDILAQLGLGGEGGMPPMEGAPL
jgi:hypothetical protein